MVNNFKNKKVLILGLGINQGGLGSARFFAKNRAQVKVTDLKPAEQLQSSLDQLKEFSNIEYTLGQHRYEDIDWADIVILNQALKPTNPYRQYAQKQAKAETDFGIFSQFVKPEQVIGVTGTKGKSTTSSLIYEVLKTKNAVYAGNIGKSVLDAIEDIAPNTLVVLEISSFQLEGFDRHKFSPRRAVITNLHPDHLDYYGNMDNYIESKKNIAKYQTTDDYLFLLKDDEITSAKDFRKGLKARIIEYSQTDLPEGYRLSIPGEHNLTNASAAQAVFQTLGVDPDTALEAMKNFAGVEFRLQLIKEWNGIKIYNDTAATGPTATIQALNSFKNPIMIVGGVDKGLPYQQLAYELDRKAKAVFFLDGTASDKLKELMRHNKIRRSTYFDLNSLLKAVKTEIKKGDIVLFSPAAASFNMFQNEFDRGRKFNQAVENIFN